jgi:hypothetical protein
MIETVKEDEIVVGIQPLIGAGGIPRGIGWPFIFRKAVVKGPLQAHMVAEEISQAATHNRVIVNVWLVQIEDTSSHGGKVKRTLVVRKLLRTQWRETSQNSNKGDQNE